MLKRAFDLLAAATLLLLLWPVMLAAALLVRWKLGAPVLFLQQRPGLHAQPFTLIKFRTMNEGTQPDEARMTPFGALLRRTSLDELPQLLNVLAGDMSMVGPRPLLMEYLPLYSARQARRHEVRPGITGWAQVSGRNALGWSERLELDAQYVEQRSFALDLRILFLTFARVLSRQGVSQKGAATMEKFKGNEQER